MNALRLLLIITGTLLAIPLPRLAAQDAGGGGGLILIADLRPAWVATGAERLVLAGSRSGLPFTLCVVDERGRVLQRHATSRPWGAAVVAGERLYAVNDGDAELRLGTWKGGEDLGAKTLCSLRAPALSMFLAEFGAQLFIAAEIQENPKHETPAHVLMALVSKEERRLIWSEITEGQERVLAVGTTPGKQVSVVTSGRREGGEALVLEYQHHRLRPREEGSVQRLLQSFTHATTREDAPSPGDLAPVASAFVGSTSASDDHCALVKLDFREGLLQTIPLAEKYRGIDMMPPPSSIVGDMVLLQARVEYDDLLLTLGLDGIERSSRNLNDLLRKALVGQGWTPTGEKGWRLVHPERPFSLALTLNEPRLFSWAGRSWLMTALRRVDRETKQEGYATAILPLE